jgi:uncharacterized membrane protein YeiH
MPFDINSINFLMMVFMITGVIATSIGGVLRANNAKMDITGAILLAFITSNFGGTIRDLLLHAPIFWIKEQFYIWISFTTGAISFIFIYYRGKIFTNNVLYKVLIFTDAMGIAAFCLAGVEKALSLGQNYFMAVLMGLLTAVGGGIVADIISNQIPLVLYSELYITVALLGALLYLFLDLFMQPAYASLIAAIFMVLLRLTCVKYKLKLPKLK